MALSYIQQEIYLTVDNVLFSLVKGELQVLLIQRKHEPGKGGWALPGGFLKDDESLDQAAERELHEETNVKNIYLEQLYTFSEVERDPRARIVSTVYMAIVNAHNLSLKAGTDAADAKFFPVQKLPTLAFDHADILSYALKRLQYKMEYTNVAQYLLPQEFTLKQLQDAYQTVFDREFDVRNFRKKIHALHIIKETGKMQEGVKHRPAKLYTFIDREIKIVEVVGVSNS